MREFIPDGLYGFQFFTLDFVVDPQRVSDIDLLSER